MTELGPDEELTPQRRRRRGVEFGLALLIIAALAAYANHARGGNHPNPTPTSTLGAPTPGGLTSAHAYGTGIGLLAEQPDEQPTRAVDDPAACPWAQGCSQSFAVPSAVRAAVRAQFPTATSITCNTLRLVAGQLWFRQISASISGAHLVVRVERPLPGRSTTDSGRLGGTAYLSRPLRSFEVVTELDRPGEVVGMLGRLAADARLLAA